MVERFHIHISDELAKRLDDYIKASYDKPYGKRRLVGVEALTSYLDQKEDSK